MLTCLVIMITQKRHTPPNTCIVNSYMEDPPKPQHCQKTRSKKSCDIVVRNVRTRSVFSDPSCTVVGHTVTRMEEWEVYATFKFCIRTMTQASSAQLVVRDKPGGADILLGSSLLCETAQKDEQQGPVCCHGTRRSLTL